MSDHKKRAAQPVGKDWRESAKGWANSIEPPPVPKEWEDSIKAADLAEEIARHFGHNCEECNEDSDTDNCAMAWVEEKLIEFLDAIAESEKSSTLVEKEFTGQTQSKEE